MIGTILCRALPMSSIRQLFECFACAKNEMAELAPHHFTILEPIQFVRIDKIVLNCTSATTEGTITDNYAQVRQDNYKNLVCLKLIDKSKTQDHV